MTPQGRGVAHALAHDHGDRDRAPAPKELAICIFTPDCVTLLDVPLLSFMKALSSWSLCTLLTAAKIVGPQRGALHGEPAEVAGASAVPATLACWSAPASWPPARRVP